MVRRIKKNDKRRKKRQRSECLNQYDFAYAGRDTVNTAMKNLDRMAPKIIEEATSQVDQIAQKLIQQIVKQGGQQVEKLPPKQ